MALRLYNTLTQQLEEFQPARDNTVRMYTCGPTVYDFAHIGNFRTFTFVDILRRWLRARGFGLNHVMNITDVDDKIIRNAAARQQMGSKAMVTQTGSAALVQLTGSNGVVQVTIASDSASGKTKLSITSIGK
jgi:cysteinyl-tRNA synthetase